MTDSDILALYNERDETAITHTAEVYGGYCRAIAMQILQDAADAEECINDTYLRAWNAIPPAAPENLRAYLGKITRHLAFDTYKKRTADKRGGGQLPLILDELSECLPSGDEPAYITDRLLMNDCLNQFLSGLSTAKRYMFLRRYWYADTVEEIAKAIHCSENSVYVTLSRLRKQLRVILEKEGMNV